MVHTVMIVDDMEINLMQLEGILSDKYEVLTAQSGKEAFDRLRTESHLPDLILLDISMPEMSGFELISLISIDSKLMNIPVIFLTGETDEYSEEKGLNLGAVDYIRKPYNPDIILIKIKNHIELKTYRDDLEKAVLLRTRELEERTRELEERTVELQATHDAIILGMSLLSESRDRVTGAHLARIQLQTYLLAKKISELYPELLSEEMVKMITAYSPLHDVGKVAVPDAVLNKAGGLTKEEFELMKTHTTGGGDLLRQIVKYLPGEQSQLDWAIDISEGHHERYDGTGYPKKLKGEEIPIAARVVAVPDVYDALRSTRPYKRGFTHEEAMDIILVGDGRTHPSHFDPKVLEAFRLVHEQMRDAYDANPDMHIGEGN